jgi:putative membrane protein
MPLVLVTTTQLNPLSMAVLLVTLIISTNYFEFIKTTYLSTPDEDNALSLRYAQKLLQQGRGLEAIKLLSLGALGATLITAMITPLIISQIPIVYEAVEDFIAVALITLSAHLILKEGSHIGKALKIFTFASVLGVLTLRTEIINQPLLPLLTGFYGASNIIMNLQKQENIPSQMSKVVTEVDHKTTFKGMVKAALSSSIITFIPAIGPSQASIISNELVKTRSEKEKLITLGGVNTGDVIFSITALFAINKARSGVIEQISSEVINQNNYLILLLTAVITAVICYKLVNKTANSISKRISNIDYTKLNIGLLGLIIMMVLLINGPTGLLILTTSTIIGLKAIEDKVNQSHLMAALIVPTIIYYL